MSQTDPWPSLSLLPDRQNGDNNLGIYLSECFKNTKTSKGLDPLVQRPTQDTECPLLVEKPTAENAQDLNCIKHNITKPLRSLEEQKAKNLEESAAI